MSTNNLFLKKLWLYRYGISAAGLIVCAAILRIILLALGWTATESDEAMNNLAAMHIEKLGERPIFFYGQNYLGNFESYVGAILYRIFGPSVQLMRIEMIAFSVGFLICMYFITKKLYTKGFALFILLFFLLGSQWTIRNQMEAGGYPEVPLFAAALFLTACTLALSYHQLPGWKRCLLYALWGLLAGLALWIQLLLAPYVLISGLLILAFCWKDLFTRVIWCVVPALLIGSAPLIYYNLHAAPGMDSLTTLINLSHMGYNPHQGFIYHLKITFFFVLPIATSFVPACSIQPGTSIWSAQPHPLRCMVVDGAWSLSYLSLMLIGLLLAIVALRKANSLNASPERHQQLAQQFARLMLIVGICISLFSLVQGNAENLDATNTWRYLICTWISLPAVLWPLWTAEKWFASLQVRRSVFTLKWAALLLVVFVLLHSTALIFQQSVPIAQMDRQHVATLEKTLEQQHITRFYTEYWTCGRIIFDTQEQLICGDTYDFNNQLSHGFDRYPLYPSIVEHASYPSFVYPDGAQQITTLNQLLARSHTAYQRIEVPGYVIYKMYGRIPSLPLYA